MGYAYFLKKNPYPVQNNFSVCILLCILVSLLLGLISFVGRGIGSGDIGAEILNNTWVACLQVPTCCGGWTGNTNLFAAILVINTICMQLLIDKFKQTIPSVIAKQCCFKWDAELLQCPFELPNLLNSISNVIRRLNSDVGLQCSLYGGIVLSTLEGTP